MESQATKPHNDPEPKNVGNGIAVYDTSEEMQDSWRDRAKALAAEMKAFGWCSVFYYAVLGLLHETIHDLQSPES